MKEDYQTKIANYTTTTAWSYTPPIFPQRPEPPPRAIPPLGGRPPQRQSRYKLPVCKDPILPTLPPKPPDMPIDIVTSAYQPSNIEDEAVDVEAIEPELNTAFKENAPQQEGIIHEVY